MKRKVLHARGALDPVGPYSHAVMAGGFLYLSGQIGLDPATGAVPGMDIESETHQVMKNIAAVLKDAGYSFEDLVKVSIFVTDLGNAPKINAVYSSYLTKGNYPAREMVEVSKLPKNVNVEISVTAYKG